MLSILIPIHNYNVLPLVEELHQQCTKCLIDFEILCQDDASNSPLNVHNEKVNLLPHCHFKSLEKNVAHRENRNQLAKQAKYPYLLFIDGDSIIVSGNYISNYIQDLKDFDIVYGGRIHSENCPSDNQKLRWKYGKHIEDKLAEDRKKSIYQSLLFNNTIIRKDLFEKVKFDENLKKYGHDDTQLAYQMSLLQVKVNHIDNQILHGDIDKNKKYLKKTEESLENLIVFEKEQLIDINFISILKFHVFLKKFKLDLPISFFFRLLKPLLTHNLLGKNPSLLLFNIYRLGYLCSLN